MPKFRFFITADATMSAYVEVEADTFEHAHFIALAPSFYRDPAKARFQLDDANDPRDVYGADEDAYEEFD